MITVEEEVESVILTTEHLDALECLASWLYETGGTCKSYTATAEGVYVRLDCFAAHTVSAKIRQRFSVASSTCQALE